MNSFIDLWPWGIIIVSLLSAAIGWLLREIQTKKIIDKKNTVIQAQEREYVKLAQKHMDSTNRYQATLDQMENQKLDVIAPIISSSTPDDSKDVRAKEKIRELEEEIDKLNIERLKLTTVPNALFIEKIKILKEENISLKNKLNKKKNPKSFDKGLKVKLKRCKKKLRKKLEPTEFTKEIVIKESIDYDQLAALIKKLPVKTTRDIQTIADSSKKQKKRRKTKKDKSRK